MNFILRVLLCLCTVAYFSLTAAANNPTKPIKVFGISHQKAFNDELKPVARMVYEARQARAQFVIQKPLTLKRTNDNFSGSVKKSAVHQIKSEDIKTLLTNRSEYIELQIQDADGKTWSIDLAQVQTITHDFVVKTSQTGDSPVFIEDALTYRGVVKGDYNSVAAFSIFDGNIIGMISSDAGNMVLHPLESEAGAFIFYNDQDMSGSMPFTCGTEELQWSGHSEENTEEGGSRDAGDCVRVYIECDYDLYVNKGSNVNNVVNWITAVYNNVATLYANESINTTISEIYVWNTSDPYSETSSSTALNQFRNLRPNFNGDLAHLAAYGGNNIGGIAWVNALCSNFNYAYSNISSNYQNVPAYSWTVMVLTHEMGHNLGSNHTQWCGWSGGALDNCYPVEGSCNPGPAPTNGGTIMSYCHLTSYGVNLNNGFGVQPGNKIRSRVAAVSCLSPDCSGGGDPPGPCSTPTGLAAINITTTTASVTWNSVPGAASYNFQYKLSTSSVWSQVTVTGLGVNFSFLTPNTSYNCRVQAVCSGSSSAFSDAITFTTLGSGSACNAPSGLSTSGVTSSSAIINWNTVSGASSYTLEYKLSSASIWNTVNVNSPPYTLNGLSASSAYQIRVRTNCSSSQSSYSNTVNFSTSSPPACNAPTGLNSSGVTESSALINWNTVSGAISYTLEYKLASALNWTQVGVASPPHTLNGLTPGSSYQVRVRTNCNGSQSSNSNIVTFTTLNEQTCDAPTGLNASSVSTSSALINWNAVSGAISYTLEYKLASAANWTQVGVASPPHTLNGLTPNSSYQIRVRTNCNGSQSSNSNIVTFTTQSEQTCDAPSGLNASSVSTSSALINWNAVSGAISYTLEYKLVSAANWTQVGLASPPHTLNGLTPNSSYQIRVRTNCNGSQSSNSNIVTFTTQNEQTCDAPTGLNVSDVSASSVLIDWNDVSGAISYTLEYKLASASNWTQVGVVSPPHTLNGLTPNSSYQVRVRTNCNGSQSSNSNTVTFTTTNIESCGTPSGLVVNNTTQTSAVVSWNPVPGAISYTVQYKSTRSGFWMSADVSAPPYTITGLSPFQSYEVRVRANCNGSQSAFSDIVTFVAENSQSCDAVSGLLASNVNTSSAVISWNPVNGALSYTLEYKLNSAGNWTQVSAANSPYILNGLQSSSNYNVRVRTNCSGGQNAYSSTINFTTTGAQSCNVPAGLNASSVTQNSAEIDWNDVAGAISYTLEYKLSSSGTWTQVGVPGPPHSLNGLSQNTTYNVRVRTNCAGSNSAFSNTISFTTQGAQSCNVPGALVSGNITSSSVSLDWNSVSGAISYIVDYKLSSSGNWITLTSAVSNLDISGLQAGVSYDWKVKTVCAAGSSAFSAVASFSTENDGTGTGYCESAGQNADLEWISQVTIGAINRISESDGGYFDATNLSATVTPGRSQILTHRAGFSQGNRTLYWRIWIDLNADGDFNDANELVASKVSNSSSTLTSIFTIPATATLGLTRMRVQAKYNSYGSPCETFANGEVEDYSIEITSLNGLPSSENEFTEINMNDLKIYPNPANEQLTFSFQSLMDSQVNIQIVDILGRMQKEEEFQTQIGENKFYLDVSKLHAGQYILMLKNGKQILNHRFIKAE